MSLRRALALLLLGLVPACKAPAPAPRPSPSPAARPQPNVVLILVDTLRADSLPFTGYPRDTAPFLGELAARGVVFERAYSTSGWTVPATASLFTSLWPTQHGLVENLGRKQMRKAGVQEKEVAALPSAVKTLPEVMKEAGYATFGASDNFHVSALRGFDRGFDRFGHGNDTGSVKTNGRVLEWKAEILSGKPYFLYVHYMDPHNPYEPRQPWFQEYKADGKVEEWRAGNKKAAYDSEIRYLDDNIRALSRELGWDRNTIVLVTADHGEEFGEHGGGGHASTLYRELVDVPLLAWSSDGRFPPRRVADPVGLVDVLPTLRQVAGLPADPAAQGVSLMPLLETGAGGDRRRTFFAHLQTFAQRHRGREIEGVFRERWKWLRHQDGTELYDTYADRAETKNLAAEEARVAADLAATWRRFSETARRYEGTRRTFKLDQETEDKLRALGYVQ